ncbi:MAG: VWA domain-containing protein [Clostridia bacterium]|nr:VWA domain-containing protein [Clostridia bacterium]
MGLQGSTKYDLDIVFCIDVTGSMGPIMDEVKSKALGLHQLIVERFERENKPIDHVRVKVIEFSDYATEGGAAIKESDFLNLPDDADTFSAIISSIDVGSRGGDDPENGLEAVYKAFMSDWAPLESGKKNRQIIVVFSDAYPMNFQERSGCADYEDGDYPESFTDLQEMWGEGKSAQGGVCRTKMVYNNHRLVLFVPNGSDEAGHTWDGLAAFESTTKYPVNPADGLEGIDLSVIIDEIFKSC